MANGEKRFVKIGPAHHDTHISSSSLRAASLTPLKKYYFSKNEIKIAYYIGAYFYFKNIVVFPLYLYIFFPLAHTHNC